MNLNIQNISSTLDAGLQLQYAHNADHCIVSGVESLLSRLTGC